MTDYTQIGLDSNLQPMYAPISEQESISGYKFDATNERGAISSSFLAGIRDEDGSIVVNKYGLTNGNFPIYSNSQSGIDYVGTAYGEVGTAGISISGIKKDVNVISYVNYSLYMAPIGGSLATDANIRITYQKSSDGTSYTNDSYSDIFNFDNATDVTSYKQRGSLFSNKTLSYTDGTSNFKYWKIILESIVSNTGTGVGTLNIDYGIGAVILGA